MSSDAILYSFRRCPYAIRARLALDVSGRSVELREIVLRDKAPEFLAASPTATVPCLVQETGVIDESLDIMLWALGDCDPEEWLRPESAGLGAALELIGTIDGPFKRHLDRYKYDTRFADADRAGERGTASGYLRDLDARLASGGHLFGARPCLADQAILPFVRQFANTDRDWFEAQDWPRLRAWLAGFEASPRFARVMQKWTRWHAGDACVLFPEP